MYFWLKKKVARGGRSARLNRNRNRRASSDHNNPRGSPRNRIDDREDMDDLDI